MKQILATIVLLLSSISMEAQTKNNEMKYNKIQVEDCRVFFREAGSPEKPAILLLHGFPSSSHMFRELMPELADEYHLIAPDFPAFGQTESPNRESFTYSFDHLARIVDKFTESIGLTKFAMYVFDYGAPIGYRLAMWHPERITAINLPEWQHVRRRTWQEVGSPQGILEESYRRTSPAVCIGLCPRNHHRTIHFWNPRRLNRSRRLFTRLLLCLPAWTGRDAERPHSRLSLERCPLPRVSEVPPYLSTTFVGCMGRERPFVHSSRCQSLQARPAQC